MLAELRQKNIERQEAWPGAEEVEGDLAFRGLELAGETGELCNVLKKIERIRRGVAGTKPEELPGLLAHVKEELGDVVICVDLIAMELGISMEEAVPEKFNKTSVKYGIPVKFPEPPRKPVVCDDHGHDWVYDGHGGGHRGEYDHTCADCGATDWFASYGMPERVAPGLRKFQKDSFILKMNG